MIKNNNFSAQSSYVAPECKSISVLGEGVICSSGDGTWDNSIKDGSTWGGDDDYGLE